MRKYVVAILLAVFWLNTPAIQAAPTKAPIIFVIDTSGSMKAKKLVAVKEAVTQIVNSLQKDQPVGIVSFSEEVFTTLQPTLDFDQALRQIDSLFAVGDTSMYDAVAAAFSISTINRPGQLVLLSDGEDTTSVLKLDELLIQATTAGIPVNAIGIQVAQGQKEILTAITKASGGNYYGVDDITTLIATYREILAEQLDPTAGSTPLELEGELRLNQNVYVEVVLATFAAIILYLLLTNIYRRVRNREQQLARVQTLQKYSYRRVRKASNRVRISITSYSFIPNRVENAIRSRLELIHSELKYETVIRIFIGVWVFLVVLFSLMLHSPVLAIILASALLPLGFNAIINNIRTKQKLKFAEELPELLNILASALRAGLSLPQGLEAYSSDTKGEVAREIRRSISEIRVGTPIDEALMGVAERMDSEDLRWAVTALSIQRVVGGSMATILTTTFETVKARAEIRREVKTLSAEGKLSAYVLIALPIGIFSFLFLTRREYVKVFWTDPAGIFLLIIIGISLSIGWAWMKKIVEIKI
ncbi:MAG: VWA domain-containing protein [Actinobacteria bacterium]|uniref:Unannotated protein n=1 Tax=freshwater metagenome TaxID=449393 RepID=A0A6J7U1A5_9ZZZZ|nr:VWA domain-containing protein [Actinomycetota bacterium]